MCRKFGSEKRDKFADERSKTPGPGAYCTASDFFPIKSKMMLTQQFKIASKITIRSPTLNDNGTPTETKSANNSRAKSVGALLTSNSTLRITRKKGPSNLIMSRKNIVSRPIEDS